MSIDPQLPATIGAVAAGIAVVLGSLNAYKIEKVKKTGEAIHTLSNSAMGAQLKMNVANLKALSVVLHRVASGSKSESDEAAATAVDVQVMAAEKLYNEHVTQQVLVDQKVKEN